MIEDDVWQPEISKTDGDGIPTPALLEKLSFFGVSEQDVKNEVTQGFLPTREGGLWSPFAVRRAKRLYRLRHRGTHGKMLKILLFIGDGWGWEGIRDHCATGLERTLALSLNGVERYAKTKGGLDFAVDDIAEHQHKALISKVGDRPDLQPTSSETTAYYIGMLRDGAPLKDGSPSRIIRPIVKTAFPKISEELADLLVLLFDLLARLIDIRASTLVARLREATASEIEHGRLSLRENLRFIRLLVRRMAGNHRNNHSFNLLTFFGYAKQMKEFNFSQGDVKLTQTLVFAGLVGGFISLDVAMNRFLDSLPPWLSDMFRMVLGPHGDTTEHEQQGSV